MPWRHMCKMKYSSMHMWTLHLKHMSGQPHALVAKTQYPFDRTLSGLRNPRRYYGGKNRTPASWLSSLQLCHYTDSCPGSYLSFCLIKYTNSCWNYFNVSFNAANHYMWHWWQMNKTRAWSTGGILSGKNYILGRKSLPLALCVPPSN